MRGGRGGTDHWGPGPRTYHRGNMDSKLPRGANLHATLIVKRLPPEFNTIDKLNKHFQSFGTIINVKVNIGQGSNSALVQFSCLAEAKAAMDDPKPLFENRHISVEHATEADDETGAIPTVSKAADAASGDDRQGNVTQGTGDQGAVPGQRPPKIRIHQAPQAYSYRKPKEEDSTGVEAKTKVMLKQREVIVAKIQALKAQGKPTAEAESLLESVDKMMGDLFKDAKPVTPKAEVKSIRLENVDPEVTLEHLSTHFHKFGQGATVTRTEEHAGRYIVEFTERRFAAAAVRHGSTVNGCSLLMFWHNPSSAGV